ncbi:MAG TPA: hypothetical protein VFE62_12280, partial [Gemmataceae bacterium]|nr:hypothetical protein [Gemmataceae bacterium]
MLKPLGYQQLTLAGTAQALTVPDGTRYVTLRAEGADARWRDDGTDPTASIGMPLKATDTAPYLYIGPAEKLKFIEVAAGAIVNASFY